jgi:phosphatidylinositol-3-phosphatase
LRRWRAFGAPGGLVSADVFLQKWVPIIMNSPAYRKDGLLIINFDEIGSFTLTFGSYGGDRTGAVLLSPFITPGTVANTGFNHYSMLKTIEDIFGLDYLGYAGAPGLVSFFGCAGSDVATHALGQNGCQ